MQEVRTFDDAFLASSSQSTVVKCTQNADSVLVKANRRRIALSIYCLDTNGGSVSDRPMTASLQGVPMFYAAGNGGQQMPLNFNGRDHGEFVTHEFHIWGNGIAGTYNMFVVETFAPCDCFLGFRE